MALGSSQELVGLLESPGCPGIAPTSLGHSDWPHTLQCRQRTATQASASGPALWVFQVTAYNRPSLYVISHPYLPKGRQKLGKILTSQCEALKSSSFSNKPGVYQLREEKRNERLLWIAGNWG